MNLSYVEKRRNRGQTVTEALARYFAAVLGRERLKALVLADTDGLVLSEAHNDPALEPETIASCCPLVIRIGGNCYDGRTLLAGRENYAILLFLYNDQPLYLVGVGDGTDACDALLSTVEGVQRILGN